MISAKKREVMLCNTLTQEVTLITMENNAKAECSSMLFLDAGMPALC